LELARLLRGKASACIDLSDGLAADLGHILAASGKAAHLDSSRLPGPADLALSQKLSGGDDYELCFCLGEGDAGLLPAWSEALGIPLTVVGKIHSGQGLTVIDARGRRLDLETAGYEHFANGEASHEAD
jgi:thiamine-monophosphate kinase